MEIRTPVFLYRLYDTQARLLYIGITTNVGQRMTAHKSNQPWWHSVADIKVEMLGSSRPAAETAEHMAILAEKPLHNLAKTRPPKPATMAKVIPLTPRPRLTAIPSGPPAQAEGQVNERGTVFVHDGKGITVTMTGWPQTKHDLLIAKSAVPASMWRAFEERMNSGCRT